LGKNREKNDGGLRKNLNHKIWRATEFGVMLSCIVLAILLRLPYMYGPADLDEGNYATIGMIISKGAVLYRDIGDSKPPLIYYVNALVSLIFGSNLQVLRLLFAMVSGVTGVFVFLTAKKVYGAKVGIISAYLFILFSSSSLWGYHSPTNIYSSLMESIAVYFLITAFLLREREATHAIIAGVFIALSVLMRQTSILLFVTSVMWYLIRFSWHEPFHISETVKQTLRKVSLIVLGGAVAFLPVILYFVGASGLDDMTYWVLMEPIPGMTEHTPWSLWSKVEWFTAVVLTIFPLLFLAVIVVKNEIKHKAEETLLMFLWMILPILFFLLSPVPGYVHYYYQILPSLCIMAGKGITSLHSNLRQTSAIIERKGFRRLVPTRKQLISALLIISVILSLVSNIVAGQAYVCRYDSQVAMKVADFIKNHTSSNEKIFVLEFWVKIGPLIYYLSERCPPVPRPFFFTYMQNGITISDVESVEKALLEEDVKYVVFIGPPPPPEWPASKLLLTILSQYYPFYVVTDKYVQFPASPAPPWVSELEVVVYKRLDSWSQQIKSVDVEGNVTIKYDFPSQGRWVTEVRSIEEYREWLTMPSAALSFEILANEDNNTLYIDLFDAKGNFREFGLFLDFKGWKKIVIPISNTFFPKRHAGSPNFEQIKNLHFLLEHTVREQPYPEQPVSGSLSGLVLIKNLQILYIERTNVGIVR